MAWSHVVWMWVWTWFKVSGSSRSLIFYIIEFILYMFHIIRLLTICLVLPVNLIFFSNVCSLVVRTKCEVSLQYELWLEVRVNRAVEDMLGCLAIDGYSFAPRSLDGIPRIYRIYRISHKYRIYRIFHKSLAT